MAVAARQAALDRFGVSAMAQNLEGRLRAVAAGGVPA
jgi:hypothetical protein